MIAFQIRVQIRAYQKAEALQRCDSPSLCPVSEPTSTSILSRMFKTVKRYLWTPQNAYKYWDEYWDV